MLFSPSLNVLTLASLIASPIVIAARLPSNQFSPRSSFELSADICAYIDVEIAVDVNLGLIDLDVNVDVKACLCLNTLVDFCAQKAAAQGLTTTQHTKLLTSLKNMIQRPGGAGKMCTYPSTPGCSQSCSASNVCGFTCPVGYKPSTDQYNNPTCVCSSSDYWSCNGQCIPNGQLCPSQAPTSPKARANEKRRQAHPTRPWCPRGKSACGIYENGGDAWECVDTTSDLESCGGCTIPLRASSIPGVDCSQIPHISDVACVLGECRVFKCRRGFVVGKNGTECVADQSSRHDQQASFLDVTSMHFKS
ncbi:Dihydroxyacetone synthase [Tulasnella sp. JGI-2019a]|nr:Dihydroxyacetone synthase [Tulasnella sp. JGI-2019a]